MTKNAGDTPQDSRGELEKVKKSARTGITLIVFICGIALGMSVPTPIVEFTLLALSLLLFTLVLPMVKYEWRNKSW